VNSYLFRIISSSHILKSRGGHSGGSSGLDATSQFRIILIVSQTFLEWKAERTMDVDNDKHGYENRWTHKWFI